MNATTTPDAYGELIEPTTLRIQRLLPGPVERIWAALKQKIANTAPATMAALTRQAHAFFEHRTDHDNLTTAVAPLFTGRTRSERAAFTAFRSLSGWGRV